MKKILILYKEYKIQLLLFGVAIYLAQKIFGVKSIFSQERYEKLLPFKDFINNFVYTVVFANLILIIIDYFTRNKTTLMKKLLILYKEYKIQLLLLLFGVTIYLAQKIFGVKSIFSQEIYEKLLPHKDFINNFVYAVVFTNLILIIIDYFTRNKTTLYDNLDFIDNDQIADEIVNKKNVFMLRFTSHPKVDEAEDEILNYSFNNEQWDWHICLCDPEHKLPSKYNDFSYLLNSFFELSENTDESYKKERKYLIKGDLQTTELAIYNQKKFTTIVEQQLIPYINYHYKDSLKNCDIKGFHSIIFIGIKSNEPKKSLMPMFKDFTTTFNEQTQNIQFHRLIINLPSTTNNIIFKNFAADKISKFFFEKLHKIDYEKEENETNLSVYISDKVTEEIKNNFESKINQQMIDKFYYLLNEKSFPIKITTPFDIGEFIEKEDIERFYNLNRYTFKHHKKEKLTIRLINELIKESTLKFVYLPSKSEKTNDRNEIG